MADRGKVRPDCIYAPNPYHECTDYCLRKMAEGRTQSNYKKSGSSILEVSASFGKKKKGSRPKPPQEHDRKPLSRTNDFDARSPRSPPGKKLESRNRDHVKPAEIESEEIHDQKIYVPTSGNLVAKPDLPSDSPKHGAAYVTDSIFDGKETKLRASSDLGRSPVVNNGGGTNASPVRSSFSFSGIAYGYEDSYGEEVPSPTSESCISVGNYHVKASFSSILQSIFAKYGDIAANCKLESLSMRTYYLECVCYMIQELQGIEFSQLTKSKVRELLAILKDAESAEMNVGWLRNILDEITEGAELSSQYKTAEVEKENCDLDLEKTKKELEYQLHDLARREQEVAVAKANVAETQARLSELEFQSSQLNEMILSIQSKVDSFKSISLSDDLDKQ